MLNFAILGLGGRGREAYGSWIVRNPDRARIVAVADPLQERVDSDVADAAYFADWKELVEALPGLNVDAVIVALPDQLHVDAMMCLYECGIPILLEKPAAPTSEDLDKLVEAAKVHAAVPVAVGHVLRFTPFWKTVRRILDAEVIGELVTLEIRENIGFWHFAHSYVRGNWHKVAESSPMVLAKTCHDLDLIRWLTGDVPETIASVGSLKHFISENKPEGAPQFCVEGCPAQETCPFYAPRYYVDALAEVHGVPVTLVTADTSPEGRLSALGVSDYGRCVYQCDNDVVDHQETVMQYTNGLTASLVASGLTAENTRHLMITGARGQISGHMDSGRIVIDLFSPDATLPEELREQVVSRTHRGPLKHVSIELSALPPSADAGDHRGHAGGDDGLMEEFVGALERGDMLQTPMLSLSTALDSHYMAFAAEDARIARETLNFKEWISNHRLEPSEG